MQETPIFVVHDRDQALRVAHASQISGVAVQLFSAKAAASSLGPETFQAIINEARHRYPSARIECFLDCAEDAGLALAALRRCTSHISVTLPPQAQKKITEIARQRGAHVRSYPKHGMDLAFAEYHDKDLADYIRKQPIK